MTISPAAPLIYRPDLNSYHHESLVGKKLLILGAERASQSYRLFCKAREAGAIVYVALLSNHERIMRTYIDQDTNPIMHRDFHLLVVANLFAGPDLESIAEVILEQAALTRQDESWLNTVESSTSISSHSSHLHPFFDGCITFQDNHVQLTCDLCHLWYLNGCVPDGVWSTVDKHVFRQKVQDFNLGRVGCQKIEDFIQDYEVRGASDMHFPLVLKPSTGLLFHVCSSYSMFQRGFHIDLFFRWYAFIQQQGMALEEFI